MDTSIFVPMLLILGIFWFLVWTPQKKEREEREKFLAGLKKDDLVVISSGIHGTITKVDDTTVVIDIGNKTRVTVDRISVARPADQPAPEPR